MDEKGKRKETERSTAVEPFELGLLRGWNPFREWGLARLFEDAPAERRAFRWSPACEVAENDGAYVVTVELAGAKREDVQLEIHDDVLSIRGEKKSEREEKGEKRHYVERSYGGFTRSFTLPANADADRIKASFKEGVLTVEIPKTEVAKPRVIDIKS
ncbi:MAG TPA: Hsp20/alpha crystallin family protein [Myxococcota bacterium]|nr:Hsp20/alpha crystallin family protein [Myxococcota bacterium]